MIHGADNPLRPVASASTNTASLTATLPPVASAVTFAAAQLQPVQLLQLPPSSKSNLLSIDLHQPSPYCKEGLCDQVML